MEKNKSSKIKSKSRIKGVLKTSSKGKGFLETDLFEEDIEIPAEFLNTGLNNDEVEIALLPKVTGRRQTGEVIRIIKRGKTRFVGLAEKNKGVAFLIPDDRKMYINILIPSSDKLFKKLSSGDKALVTITRWDNPQKTPEGKVVEILGKKGNHEVEIQSILLERNIDSTFPEHLKKEAEKIKENYITLKEQEIKKRKDFRETVTLTIDPLDAKDFDDAISFKKLDANHFEVGIHIADVSWFVKPESELDKEAEERGFSVYLVDRTIPMLPQVLSDDVCSLNPKEDKLAFSAVFELTRTGGIKKRWFGKTVIRSNERLTYEKAQKIIDSKDQKYASELGTLNTIAKNLAKEKFRQGAISFEDDEVRFELDAEGKPVRVYRKKRLEAHKLVEELMLLANREVAKRISKDVQKGTKGRPFVYRVHDKPDREKIEELSLFLKVLGYELHTKENVTSKDINALLKKVEGQAEEGLVKQTAIRSMAKAIYSTQNIGHYGLAFSHYTHFTSPIRRYPDLLVHRLLDKYLRGEKIGSKELSLINKTLNYSTQKEITVQAAERDSTKLKQVEFMKEKIGKTFEGIISGITEWGIYVEEKTTKAEGMVALRSLDDDFYELDKKTYSVVGQKTKRRFTLGDRVSIKVQAVNVDRKTIDYKFV